MLEPLTRRLHEVTVRPTVGTSERNRWDALMDARHYLAFRGLVGRSVRHVAVLGEHWLALIGWHAGAFKLQARDRRIARVPVEDWMALVRDVHAGYITWDQYESNLRQLCDNHRGSVPPGPAREGAALLQGIVLCGLCGTHMLTRYRPGKHAPRAEYFCNGRLDQTAAPRCQSIPGAFIDRAIGMLLIELVEPVALETALSVHEELQARNDEVAALREQAVQRAREAAELARRRYMETDPGNRLVADVLEAEWENGLRAVREAEEERDRRRAEDRLAVGDDARRRILALATDFPRLWNDPATPNRERKRMARVLIEDITLTRGTRGVLAGIRLRGGQTRQLCVRSTATPTPGSTARRSSPRSRNCSSIYNVCKHRGHELLAGAGRALQITCPTTAGSTPSTGASTGPGTPNASSTSTPPRSSSPPSRWRCSAISSS